MGEGGLTGVRAGEGGLLWGAATEMGGGAAGCAELGAAVLAALALGPTAAVLLVLGLAVDELLVLGLAVAVLLVLGLAAWVLEAWPRASLATATVASLGSRPLGQGAAASLLCRYSSSLIFLGEGGCPSISPLRLGSLGRGWGTCCWR